MNLLNIGKMTFDELLNSLMKLRDRHAVREEQQATDGRGTYWYKNEATQNIINELKKRRTIDRPDHLSNLDYEELLDKQRSITDLLKNKKEEKTQQLCDNIHEQINKINSTKEEVTIRLKVKSHFNDISDFGTGINYEIEVVNANDLPERLVTTLTNNRQLGFQALSESTEKSLKEAQDTINKKFRVLTELEGSKASERLFAGLLPVSKGQQSYIITKHWINEDQSTVKYYYNIDREQFVIKKFISTIEPKMQDYFYSLEEAKKIVGMMKDYGFQIFGPSSQLVNVVEPHTKISDDPDTRTKHCYQKFPIATSRPSISACGKPTTFNGVTGSDDLDRLGLIYSKPAELKKNDEQSEVKIEFLGDTSL